MAETRINAGHTSRNEWKAEETKLITQSFPKTIIYELKMLFKEEDSMMYTGEITR
jgi:hypothetical protein